MPKTLEVLGAYDEKLIRTIPVTSKREMEKALSEVKLLPIGRQKEFPFRKE